MIRINDHIAIDDSEISESFIRASGPGGQNVNKLATAVQLRFDRLIEMIRAAAVRPTPRRPTRPTLGSKVRRLEGKKRRGGVKALRSAKPVEE